MFRRKEDSLFDSTDAENTEAVESATVISAPQSQPASSASVYTASSQTQTQQASVPQRPSAPAASFRANTTSSSDLQRNRMPEAKNISTPMAAGSIADKSKGNRRVLTVGNDILLKGEIATCDRLVIDGKVDASLNEVHTVEISEQGSFKGSANIEEAEIRGLFEGDLVVRGRLVIHATGKVRGKITYGEIEIERGGEISGEIKTGAYTSQPQQASFAAPRPPRQNVKEAA